MDLSGSRIDATLRQAQLAVARAAAIAVPVIGLLAVVGWLTDIHLLTTLIPHGAAMKLNTAIAVLLLGAALWLAVREEVRGTSTTGGGGVLALALLAGGLASITLYQYASSDAASVARWFAAWHWLDGDGHAAASMSPIGGLAVALGALATGLFGWRRTRVGPWPQRVATVLALAMLTVIYGYLFDAPVLYHVPNYPAIALHTAIALELLALGVLFGTGDRGWLVELSHATPASAAARRTLVLFIGVIPLVGWTRLLGQRLGLYDTETGLAIMCVAFTGALSLLQWLTVRRANLGDRTIARLSRLYAMLSQTNQAIVRSPDEAALYRRLCEVAVEYGRFAFAWVGVLDEREGATVRVASAGEEAGCLADDGVASRAQWPHAAPLAAGRPLSTAPPCAVAGELPWFAAARRAGLHTLAVPFRRDGRVLGALNLYARDADYFAAYALPTLEEVGLDMSFALDNQLRDAARAATDAALRASEQRYQDLAARLPVGLFQLAVGPEGPPRFEYASPPFCALFDYDEAALLAGIDLPLARVITDDQAEVRRVREAYRHTTEPVSADLRFLVHGELRTVRMLARHASTDGDVRRWNGVVVDISEQVRTERERDRLRAQLMQAQRMEAIGQLTGGIAHDFNNILGSVLGFTTLALSREVREPDGKLAQYLHEVRLGAERARDLVVKMLKFSRGDQAGDAVELLAPATALDEVLRLLTSVLPASIAVSRACDPALPAIAIDAVEFHQVVMNLAINARDAMNGTGKLHVSLRRLALAEVTCSACAREFGGDFVELCVADDGPGIASADPAEVFLPFYTTKAQDKGTGLGLAMVHGIVHRAEGHIVLESAAGAGTRFRLLFPARADDAMPRPVPGTEVDLRGATGARIMVVDDEPALTRLWTELLEGAGHTVSSHHDGAAALVAFEAAPEAVDAMVLDMTMPHLSGDSLARAVLTRRPELPVFICTGYSDRLDALLAQSIGIREVFTKPVDFERVLASIDAAVARDRAPR